MTPSHSADLILTNGKIATFDSTSQFAAAVAIKDGKFVAVGTDHEVLCWKGDSTQVIDLQKRTVIPGLAARSFFVMSTRPDSQAFSSIPAILEHDRGTNL